MRRSVLVLLLCACSTLLAKTKHAPLPDSVVQAKTVYLVNHTGKQKILDQAYEAFQKWQRFVVVYDKNADLTVMFGGSQGDDGQLRMDVYPRGAEDAAFEATHTWMGTPAGMQFLDAAAQHCVDDFRKALGY